MLVQFKQKRRYKKDYKEKEDYSCDGHGLFVCDQH